MAMSKHKAFGGAFGKKNREHVQTLGKTRSRIRRSARYRISREFSKVIGNLRKCQFVTVEIALAQNAFH
jgi:hypothetical protein